MTDDSASTIFVIGSVFLFAGILMYIFPPKKINYLYGYRTRSSMKNIERWNFAQKQCSKLSVILGTLLLITGILGVILFSNKEIINTIGVIETILFVIFLFSKIEFDLKKKFGKNL